jgi:hypothetical protein
MNRVSAIVIATLLLIATVFAQPPATPKPGPEVKKLDYYVGSWTSEGDVKPGPMGPGGKITVSEDSKWMDGGFFVVIRSTSKGGAMGDWTATAYMGYDPEEKVYTYDEFNSNGEAVHAKGTVDGDTWTWHNDMKMGGQTMKGRYTTKIGSPTSYTYKFEMSTDGTTWNTIMDGKDTKK